MWKRRSGENKPLRYCVEENERGIFYFFRYREGMENKLQTINSQLWDMGDK